MVKFFITIFFLMGLNAFANPQSIDFKLYKDIDGKNIQIDEKSKKVLLYFWAHWCPECESKINNFFPTHQLKFNIPLVTINTDSKESKVRGFIEKNKMKLPVIIDTEKVFRKLSKVNGVPGWAIFEKDKSGNFVLLSSKVGFDEAEVLKILEDK